MWTVNLTVETKLHVFSNLSGLVRTRLILFRSLSLVSGYFLIRNFFFLDVSSVHRHPANSATNPEPLLNPLSEWKKNKFATNRITVGR